MRARDPQGLVESLRPLGCAALDRLPPYPAPRHALEGTYRTADGGSRSVAVVLEYDAAPAAAEVLRLHAEVVRVCRAAPYARA